MEERAFEEAARRYQDTVYRIALNYCRNAADAEDVTQNALLRLLRCATAFESDEHLRHWIIRVAVNESKRWLSSPARLFSMHTAGYEEIPETQCALLPEESALYTALMQLPKKYRIVLHLHYFEGYKAAEIGRLLQLTPSAVTTRLQRGRDCLRKTLTETHAAPHGKEVLSHE